MTGFFFLSVLFLIFIQGFPRPSTVLLVEYSTVQLQQLGIKCLALGNLKSTSWMIEENNSFMFHTKIFLQATLWISKSIGANIAFSLLEHPSLDIHKTHFKNHFYSLNHCLTFCSKLVTVFFACSLCLVEAPDRDGLSWLLQNLPTKSFKKTDIINHHLSICWCLSFYFIIFFTTICLTHFFSLFLFLSQLPLSASLFFPKQVLLFLMNVH